MNRGRVDRCLYYDHACLLLWQIISVGLKISDRVQLFCCDCGNVWESDALCCCNYSNAPKTSVGLLVESSSASSFTAVSIVSDNESSGNDFDTIFVNRRRRRSVCSSKIFSATLIQSNVTSERSRTISVDHIIDM